MRRGLGLVLFVFSCGPTSPPGNNNMDCGDHCGNVCIPSCDPMEECSGGVCVTACAKASAERSNVGCEYWPVDLDNEYSQFNDAAGQQFAVVLANTSSFVVNVTVEQNDADPGQPPQLRTVATAQIAPNN